MVARDLLQAGRDYLEKAHWNEAAESVGEVLKRLRRVL